MQLPKKRACLLVGFFDKLAIFAPKSLGEREFSLNIYTVHFYTALAKNRKNPERAKGNVWLGKCLVTFQKRLMNIHRVSLIVRTSLSPFLVVFICLSTASKSSSLRSS